MVDAMTLLREAPEFLSFVLSTIRERGWAVAVHNDYRQDGRAHTFWLFTKGDHCAKGEGETDGDAVSNALGEILRVEKTASVSSRVFVAGLETWDGFDVVRVFLDRETAQVWLDGRPPNERGSWWRVEEHETREPTEVGQPTPGRIGKLERSR